MRASMLVRPLPDRCRAFALCWISGVAMSLAAMTSAKAAAPLYDPVVLNIGLTCQWQRRCIGQQRHALKSARKYMEKADPPLWRIHLCNRNAGRSRERIDWIGFDNCIRNAMLQPPPPPPPLPPPSRIRHPKRKRHYNRS